jgi:transposase
VSFFEDVSFLEDVSSLAQLSSHKGEIEHLKLLVEKLRHMLFGVKGEKVLRQIEQLALKLEELESAATTGRRTATATRGEATKPCRRPLPEHLAREVHTHLPDNDACPDCRGELHHLGEDTAKVLEYVPASFKVIRHVRPKPSCAACDRIVQAPAPSRPIDRGLAGPGLLAHVLVSKYADHQPLYRQAKILANTKIPSPRGLRTPEASDHIYQSCVAVLQRPDISDWWQPKESAVLTAKLANALVTDFICSSRSVESVHQHPLARGL